MGKQDQAKPNGSAKRLGKGAKNTKEQIIISKPSPKGKVSKKTGGVATRSKRTLDTKGKSTPVKAKRAKTETINKNSEVVPACKVLLTDLKDAEKAAKEKGANNNVTTILSNDPVQPVVGTAKSLIDSIKRTKKMGAKNSRMVFGQDPDAQLIQVDKYYPKPPVVGISSNVNQEKDDTATLKMVVGDGIGIQVEINPLDDEYYSDQPNSDSDPELIAAVKGDHFGQDSEIAQASSSSDGSDHSNSRSESSEEDSSDSSDYHKPKRRWKHHLKPKTEQKGGRKRVFHKRKEELDSEEELQELEKDPKVQKLLERYLMKEKVKDSGIMPNNATPIDKRNFNNKLKSPLDTTLYMPALA